MNHQISNSHLGSAMLSAVYGSGLKKAAPEKIQKSEADDTPAEPRLSKEESCVTKLKQRKPSSAKAIDRMVKEGYSVLKMNGAENVDVSRMSMGEYRQHIARLLNSIPFDASRPYDEETIHISDEGWEQMKKDPEYEAWVLGYTKENRSVHNPFAILGKGAGSSYCVEHFGASPEEHHGIAFSKTYGGSAKGARSLYEAKAAGGMTKRAPQADEYPPEDYDRKQQQEKTRRKRKKQQEELEQMFFAHKQEQLEWVQSLNTMTAFQSTQGMQRSLL